MFKFDGKHASEYFDKVLLVKRDMAAPSSPILQELRDKPGAYFFGVQTGVYEVEFEVFIQGNDRQDLWKRIRKANAWLKQEELKKLEFDDEPGLYYEAICVENLELDEILEYGFGQIKFIAPDPYAFGETQKQRVGSPNVMFSREGIRYREDGSQVTENYPIYKDGKFGQAVLVEEGTTNLLATASAPAQEEVSVGVGEDYYLTAIGGSATIEHKRTETLSKTSLSKEGTDLSQTIDWETGTHNGTEVIEQKLQLKHGNDYYFNYNTKDKWEAPGTTHYNTYGNDNGQLEMAPNTWDITDPMTNLNQWNPDGDTEKISLVDNDYIRIDATQPVTQQTRIRRNHGSTSETGTMAFRARIAGDKALVWWSNGRVGIRVPIPDTGGEWSWMFIVRTSDTTADLYVDGTKYDVEITYSTSSTTDMQFYFRYAGDTGIIEVDRVYFHRTQMIPQPSIGFYEGIWESDYHDISDVGFIEYSDLWGTASYSSTIDDSDEAIVFVQYRLKVNGIEQDWVMWTPDTREIFPKGTDVRNTQIKFKLLLYLRDPGGIVRVNYLWIDLKGSYYPSGYWESQALDISQVGKAASSLISWTNQIPEGTSVKVETDISFDGGTTWEGYAEAADGNSIPGIDQATDLSNARLRYKVTLETNDVSVTPSVDSIEFSLVSGYKPSEIIELNGLDVSNIGFAETSVVSLPENSGNESTSVIFEYSIDDGQTWNELVDSQPFIQNENLTGKLLRLRYILTTSDTRFSPSIGNSLTWYIQQQEQNKIKPATQTIRVTPSGVTRWQLEKKPYPTSWHATGAREPEALLVWVKHLNETWETGGSVSFWFHDDGVVKQQFPTILDTVGDTYRVKVYKDVANGEYVLEIGGNVVLATPASIGWNHLVLTWDESNGYLYLNGSQVGTFDRVTFPLNFDGMNYLWLGSSRDKTNHLNDLIDDIALFDHKLEEAEINQLFQQPAQGSIGANIYHLDGNLVSDDDTSLVYEGTAETFPKFTITFARDTSYYRVANGRDFVLVNYDFKAGDVLEIDNQKELILLNGGPIMKAISLDSDFFEIRNGDEIIVDPAGFANVDIEFVERWV